MLQDIELQTISLTDAASKAISDIVNERKLEGYALRCTWLEAVAAAG